MIEYLPGDTPSASDLTTEVEFVGGPRGGERETRQVLPPVVIEAEEGEYARSVRCADDGALRYVWRPGPTAQAPTAKAPERSS